MATLKCYECKESFPKETLVSYAAPGSTVMHNYCPKCLKEKQERDRFAQKVCEIFGLKSPGPRIWTERKRLFNTYGYTDGVIIDCLDYIYNVKKLKKLSESLALVTPPMVEKMKEWKRIQNLNAAMLASAIEKTQVTEHQVKLVEKPSKIKKGLTEEDFKFLEEEE